jgi:hypothetical protein
MCWNVQHEPVITLCYTGFRRAVGRVEAITLIKTIEFVRNAQKARDGAHPSTAGIAASVNLQRGSR